MDLVKILLILTIASIIPGQIIRIGIFGQSGAITLTDIFVALLLVISIPYLLVIRRKLIVSKGITTAFILFTLVAVTSLVLATAKFAPSLIASSSLFLVRIIAYFLVAQVVTSIIKRDQIRNWLNIFIICGIVFTILGFMQLLLIPDITFLTPLGWDPHQRRIVATLIDPNFTGGLLAILFSIAAALYLYQKKLIYLASIFIFSLALILTFSRSSYLAIISAIFVLGIAKSPKFLAFWLLFFTSIVALNSQARERIIGAITLDETTQARVESWQRAIAVFAQNPVLGVGFNTYRYAQSQYGFFTIDEPFGGHSGSGSDSSILLVAATTGVVGLVTLAFLIVAIAKSTLANIKISALHLGAFAAFMAILVHSQFVNSFFYPQIMLPIWFIIGLIESESS